MEVVGGIDVRLNKDPDDTAKAGIMLSFSTLFFISTFFIHIAHQFSITCCLAQYSCATSQNDRRWCRIGCHVLLYRWTILRQVQVRASSLSCPAVEKHNQHCRTIPRRSVVCNNNVRPRGNFLKNNVQKWHASAHASEVRAVVRHKLVVQIGVIQVVVLKRTQKQFIILSIEHRKNGRSHSCLFVFVRVTN